MLQYTLKFVYLFLLLLPFNAAAESLMDFDFKDGILESGFGVWRYDDKGSEACNVYDGIKFSKFCTVDDSYKFYPYYNYRNNSHMGWLRYGFIDVGNEHFIRGNSLKLTLTGGAYGKSKNKVGYKGKPIFSKSDFEKVKNVNKVYANGRLPGDISFYFKTKTATSTIPQFQEKNRLTLWVLMPKGINNISTYSSRHKKRPDQNIAWYPFINSSKGGHYYHHTSNIAMGSWTKVQFDAHPVHHNSGKSNKYKSYPVGGLEYPGRGKEYFNHVTTFSLRFPFSKNKKSPLDIYIDEISTKYVPYENDETINNLAIGYNSVEKQFDLSLEDKYRCHPKCTATYQLRYSFSPITNANFEEAHIPFSIINFNRLDNNSKGLIIKASPGYNLLWAAFSLQQQHTLKLKESVKVYFAVKDISKRISINQDNSDFNIVNVPNLGEIRTIDLIKTIDYEIHEVVYPLEVKSRKLSKAIIGSKYSKKINVSGGVPPYKFIIETTLPKGLSITSKGEVHGKPTVKGDYTLKVKVLDARKNSITSSIKLMVHARSDFNIKKCKLLIDFGGEEKNDFIDNAFFSTVIFDKYTGNFKMGKTTIIGNNGAYNFQGAKGKGFKLSKGDIIRSVWYNAGKQSRTFAPLISFNDPNRRDMSDNWKKMEKKTINSGSFGVVNYKHLQPNLPQAKIININANSNQNRKLILDRIEYVSINGNKEDICEMPYL